MRTGTADLDAVRRLRLWPAKATELAQVGIQHNVPVPVLGGKNDETRGAADDADRYPACRRCSA